MTEENKCNKWLTDHEVHPYTVTVIKETALLTANSTDTVGRHSETL